MQPRAGFFFPHNKIVVEILSGSNRKSIQTRAWILMGVNCRRRFQ